MTPVPGTDLLWVGSYGPGGTEPGLRAWRIGDLLRGAPPEVSPAVPPVAALGLADATWGAFDVTGSRLHVVCEQQSGQVATVDVAALLGGAGAAAVLARQPTGGAEPCHAALSPDGGRLGVANYADGVVSVFTVDGAGCPVGPPATAALAGAGPDPDRQQGPHAHQVRWVDRDRMLVCDLGGDALHELECNPDGTLTRRRVAGAAPGAGPRHAAPAGSGALVVTEELSGTVAWWDRQPDGALRLRDRVACVADGTPGVRQPSGVLVARAGDGTPVVHVATRGADVLTTFAVDAAASRPLSVRGQTPAGGRSPRDLRLYDGVLWVADQESDELVALAVDPGSGLPGAVRARVPVPAPAWIGSSRAP